MKRKKFKFNRGIISLINKEIKSIILSPAGLVVGVLFVLVTGILVFGVGKFTQFGTNDLTQVFSYMVFALAIAVPALVMGSISREKSAGTFEYLLSKPLTEIELLFAKFTSYSILSIILVLLSLPLTIITAIYAGIDVGQVFMQYIGAIVLSICIVSVGVAVSALFTTEIASFLTTIVIIALLIIAGSSFVSFLPSSISTVLERISLLSHYQSLSRGVLDLRDLFYFVAFIFLFLALAYFLLIKDKFPKDHKYLRNSKILTILLVVISFLVGTVGQVIPGRIDFTSDQRYTLSTPTINIINNVPNNLTINYYASSNMPIEFQSEVRRVSDLLTDYSKASGGKINVNTYQPDQNTDLQTQAETEGITQIQFSVNSDDSSQVVVGYFGVVFKYEDKSEAINFNNQVLSDLEYQVTKKIKKLTETDKKVVAFVSNNVAHSINSDLTALNAELAEIFTVQNIELTNENSVIPSDINALVIAGPIEAFESNVKDSIINYYKNGGSVLLLTDTIDTSTETPVVNPNSMSDLFAEFGVKINNDIVYDLENNNIVAFQSLFSPVIFNFPQWIISLPKETELGINKDVSAVSLLWASSIEINGNNSKVYSLLETGNASNTQTEGNFNTSFEQQWTEKESDSSKVVGVALENNSGGRAIAIGDTDFITDNILEALAQRQSQDKEVISFTLNSISWLTKDDLVGSIKAKSSSAKLLNLNNSQQVTYIFVSSGVPIIIVSLLFGISTIRRRKLIKRRYQE